jgi:PKD repeat protein
MTKVFRTVCLVLVLTLVLSLGVLGIIPSAVSALGPDAIRDGFEDTTLAPNDDGYTSQIDIGFTINFFGTDYSQLWVNNNGNLTFDNYLSSYTPFNLYTANRVIIAPFFADVDTRIAGNPTRYQIWAAGRDKVDGHPAFGATWRDVDYYYSDSSHTNRNHFQVIIIDRSDIAPGDFDIEFNYDQIQWETGTASGGDANGLGGYSARAGYSDGTMANSYELPGSAVNGAFLDSNPTTGLIHGSINSSQLGRYVFWVRGGEIVEEEEEEEPPVAAARVSASMGEAPHQVQFYDMSTGDIDTWYWSFGDGGYSDAQYPTHTYQNGGAYEACLTVEGPGGSDTACLKIVVEEGATAPKLVVRNLYISATQAQPRQQVMVTADVFNEGGAWGAAEMQLLINGYYEQSAQVGVSPGTVQPISFTVYKVTPGEYQVVIGDAVGTFYVLEEPQQSQLGGIPMDSGTLIALIVIGVFVIAALVVAIVVLKPS